eukprot:COSAG02_NODE_47827_length_338_cov_0.866109_1_plen_82_part_10
MSFDEDGPPPLDDFDGALVSPRRPVGGWLLKCAAVLPHSQMTARRRWTMPLPPRPSLAPIAACSIWRKNSKIRFDLGVPMRK